MQSANAVAVLAQSLLEHGGIQELNLSHSKMDSSCAERLALLLEHCDSLRSLTLRGNKIHSECLFPLFVAFWVSSLSLTLSLSCAQRTGLARWPLLCRPTSRCAPSTCPTTT